MRLRWGVVCILLAIAGLVIAVGRSIHLSGSEQFYLGVPPVFAALTVHRWVRKRKIPKTYLVVLSVGAALIMCAAIIDHSAPSGAAGVWGRTIAAYALFAVTIVGAWLYAPFSLAIRRWGGTKQPRSIKRIAVVAASLILFSFVIYAYLLSFLQIHMPKLRGDRTPAHLRIAFEDVEWKSRDGVRIAGWLAPAESDRAAIVCHGVGADKSDMLDFVRALHEGGYTVLAFDFRGHGASGGFTVSYGAKERWDIIGAVDYLKHAHPAKSRHVVGVGWSMGAASLVLAAAGDDRIEALHLDAVYSSALEMARVLPAQAPPVYRQVTPYLAIAFACAESGVNLFAIRPVDSIKEVSCPVMIVHGEVDRLVPLSQGRRVFEAAHQPKSWHTIHGAGHCGTIGADSPRYEERMIAFLDGAIK